MVRRRFGIAVAGVFLLLVTAILAEGTDRAPRLVSAKPGLYERKSRPSVTVSSALPVKPEGVDRPQQVHSSTTGTAGAIVILLEFPDHRADTSHSASSYYELLFSSDSYPTGSMNDYYREISYGALNITGDVTCWYTAPQPYSSYVNGTHGFDAYPNNAQKMVEDAVSLADPDVDFSDYDTDGDGYVDALFVIHAGPGAEETGSAQDIWSHVWATRTVIAVDGVSLWTYSMEPEEHVHGTMITIGVFCHEFGHILGLPDLYDTDYSSDGVGCFCLMGFGSWGADGRSPHRPAHMCAWSKMRLGWISPTVVTSDLLNQSLCSIEDTPEGYLLRSGEAEDSEYFLVSNRQRVGFDSLLPGDGLLIWHVDETALNNNDESHRLLDLEEADGLNHLDVLADLNRGDGGDFFPGTTGNRTFDSDSNPSSRSYAGSPSGVAVRNISISASVVTVDLEVSGTSRPDIHVSPTWCDFGIVVIDTTGTQTLMVHNRGDATLRVINILSDNEVFRVASPVFPETVPPGGQLEVIVTFTPLASGSVSGLLTIWSNDEGNSLLLVSVTGVGGVVEPDITISATSHDFGDTYVGESSHWVLTIFNGGMGNLTVNSVHSTHSDFSVASPAFPQEILGGSFLSVSVVFSPQFAGFRTGQLIVSSNDPDEGAVELAVQGTGTVGLSEITLSALSHDFGAVPVGSSSDWLLTLRNLGTAEVLVSAIESDCPDFQVASPSFPCTLASDASLSVTIAFAPSTAGDCTGHLTVVSDDEDEGNIVVSLTGAGLASHIRVAPSHIEGSLCAGETATAELRLHNDGNVPLTFEVSTSADWLYLVPSSGTVQQYGQTILLVTLESTSLTAGEYTAHIAVFSSDPERGSVTVPVSMDVQVSFVYVGSPISYAFPRDTALVTIEMDNWTERRVPVCGFQAELRFDASIFVPVEITPTERSENMDSFVWSSPEPGRLILLISDASGCAISAGTGPIASIRFHTGEDAQAGQAYWTEFEAVVLTDEAGSSLPVTQLDGLIIIGCKGDMNCDGCIDMVDIIRVVRIILGSMSATEAEMWAADFNGDGMIDVIDLVDMVNNICSPSPPVVKGSRMVADVWTQGMTSLPTGGTAVPISMSHIDEIAGLQLELVYDTDLFVPLTLRPADRCRSMILEWADRNGRIALLMFSPTGGVIPPGHGPVLYVTGELGAGLEASPLRIHHAVLVNRGGDVISVEDTGESPRFEGDVPRGCVLVQNYPNPFNATTAIQYGLPVIRERELVSRPCRTTLKIYNILGQEVRTLVDDVHDPGHHTVTWDGRDRTGKEVVSGMYLCRLTVGQFTATRIMTLIR